MVRRSALAQRIRQEIQELEEIVSIIDRHWGRVSTPAEDQDAFLNSVALSLHGFYTGLERVMELIAVEMDGGTLGGPSWHTELLRQMALEVPSVRPAVLSLRTSQHLDDYRKFRHRIRNIYTPHLDAARMEHLIAGLPSLWQQVRAELSAFIDFLQRLESND